MPKLGVQTYAVEVARERADVRGYRHAVVVEHNHHRRAQTARLPNRLEGHATGHRPIADHSHDLALGALVVEVAHRLLDANRIADRSRGVPSTHDVVLGLRDRAKRCETTVLTDRLQLLSPAGENLVGIGLMTYVPEDLVVRRIKQRVQRDGQLARAEVGAEVTANLPHRIDDVLAHLLGELCEFLLRERLAVIGAFYAVEDGHEVRV